MSISTIDFVEKSISLPIKQWRFQERWLTVD